MKVLVKGERTKRIFDAIGFEAEMCDSLDVLENDPGLSAYVYSGLTHSAIAYLAKTLKDDEIIKPALDKALDEVKDNHVIFKLAQTVGDSGNGYYNSETGEFKAVAETSLRSEYFVSSGDEYGVCLTRIYDHKGNLYVLELEIWETRQREDFYI